MLICAGLVFFLAAFAGCSGKGISPQIKEYIGKAAEAGKEATSYRMTLAMYLDGEQWGRIKTDELTTDINGSDLALKEVFYNPQTNQSMVVQEVVRVGDKQYSKNIQNQQWEEEEPTPIEEKTANYTSHIGDFLTYSSAADLLAEEEVNGVTAHHLRFQLSARNVADLLPSTPQSNLDTNQGGQADIWLDTTTYYPVKYELLFRNVMVGQEFGYANVIIVIDVKDINQPIRISLPAGVQS
jgi:outer membrane lipoprotein-sorting protein